ncbi:hypothetical protein [Archaeoglobus sp.]
MTSQIFGKVLRKEEERRIREIERKIERFRQKYGMDFDEFFELTEGNIGKLIKMGFDPDEILRDVTEWEDLIYELDEVKKKVKSLV